MKVITNKVKIPSKHNQQKTTKNPTKKEQLIYFWQVLVAFIHFCLNFGLNPKI